MINRFYLLYQGWSKDYYWFMLQKGIRDAQRCAVSLHESISSIRAIKGHFRAEYEFPVRRPKRPPLKCGTPQPKRESGATAGRLSDELNSQGSGMT